MCVQVHVDLNTMYMKLIVFSPVQMVTHFTMCKGTLFNEKYCFVLSLQFASGESNFVIVTGPNMVSLFFINVHICSVLLKIMAILK